MDEIAEHLRGISGYNKKGEEIPSARPVELPVGFKHPPSIQEMMQRLVRNELFMRDMQANDMETFEEADDFEPRPDDDTFDRTTPYEDNFDPENPGIAAREQEIRAGFVQEIPEEKRRSAKEIIDKASRNSGDTKKPPAKKPGKAEEKEGSHGEEEEAEE